MKIAIQDLAKKIGISASTISRAINPENKHKVAPATLRKIEAAIEKYGYVPNLAARNLRKTATQTIGIVFPAFAGIFSNSYFTQMLSGIADYLLGSEYHFKIILLDEGIEKWKNYDFRSAERVDGMLVTHPDQFFSPEKIADLGVPCIFMDDPGESKEVFYIYGDHFNGGQLAARHLYELGHRQTAVIAGPDWSSDSHMRVEGFCNFMREAECEVLKDNILKADYREDLAYQAVEGLIKKNPRITGIFCCNDDMAIGAIRRLKELGIFCPKDISVVGYDDITRAVVNIPPLTTIKPPVYQMGHQAAQLLLESLRQGEKAPRLIGKTALPVELIVRQSTTLIKK